MKKDLPKERKKKKKKRKEKKNCYLDPIDCVPYYIASVMYYLITFYKLF